MTPHGVAIFHTSSSVMQAEKALLEAGVAIRLIATPREFSSDCGISVRFEWPEADSVREILNGAGVKFDKLYQMEEK